ncbi:unnamed protein product, partial [Choristocarpus tenellus]
MFTTGKERDRLLLEKITLLKKELICGICQRFLDDPYILECGDNFCHTCLDEALSKKNECPTCHLPTWQKEMNKNPLAASVVQAFQTLEEDYLALLKSVETDGEESDGMPSPSPTSSESSGKPSPSTFRSVTECIPRFDPGSGDSIGTGAGAATGAGAGDGVGTGTDTKESMKPLLSARTDLPSTLSTSLPEAVPSGHGLDGSHLMVLKQGLCSHVTASLDNNTMPGSPTSTSKPLNQQLVVAHPPWQTRQNPKLEALGSSTHPFHSLQVQPSSGVPGMGHDSGVGVFLGDCASSTTVELCRGLEKDLMHGYKQEVLPTAAMTTTPSVSVPTGQDPESSSTCMEEGYIKADCGFPTSNPVIGIGLNSPLNGLCGDLPPKPSVVPGQGPIISLASGLGPGLGSGSVSGLGQRQTQRERILRTRCFPTSFPDTFDAAEVDTQLLARPRWGVDGASAEMISTPPLIAKSESGIGTTPYNLRGVCIPPGDCWYSKDKGSDHDHTLKGAGAKALNTSSPTGSSTPTTVKMGQSRVRVMAKTEATPSETSESKPRRGRSGGDGVGFDLLGREGEDGKMVSGEDDGSSEEGYESTDTEADLNLQWIGRGGKACVLTYGKRAGEEGRKEGVGSSRCGGEGALAQGGKCNTEGDVDEVTEEEEEEWPESLPLLYNGQAKGGTIVLDSQSVPPDNATIMLDGVALMSELEQGEEKSVGYEKHDVLGHEGEDLKEVPLRRGVQPEDTRLPADNCDDELRLAREEPHMPSVDSSSYEGEGKSSSDTKIYCGNEGDAADCTVLTSTSVKKSNKSPGKNPLSPEDTLQPQPSAPLVSLAWNLLGIDNLCEPGLGPGRGLGFSGAAVTMAAGRNVYDQLNSGASLGHTDGGVLLATARSRTPNGRGVDCSHGGQSSALFESRCNKNLLRALEGKEGPSSTRSGDNGGDDFAIDRALGCAIESTSLVVTVGEKTQMATENVSVEDCGESRCNGNDAESAKSTTLQKEVLKSSVRHDPTSQVRGSSHSDAGGATVGITAAGTVSDTNIDPDVLLPGRGGEGQELYNRKGLEASISVAISACRKNDLVQKEDRKGATDEGVVDTDASAEAAVLVFSIPPRNDIKPVGSGAKNVSIALCRDSMSESEGGSGISEEGTSIPNDSKHLGVCSDGGSDGEIRPGYDLVLDTAVDKVVSGGCTLKPEGALLPLPHTLSKVGSGSGTTVIDSNLFAGAMGQGHGYVAETAVEDTPNQDSGEDLIGSSSLHDTVTVGLASCTLDGCSREGGTRSNSGSSGDGSGATMTEGSGCSVAHLAEKVLSRVSIQGATGSGVTGQAGVRELLECEGGYEEDLSIPPSQYVPETAVVDMYVESVRQVGQPQEHKEVKPGDGMRVTGPSSPRGRGGHGEQIEKGSNSGEGSRVGGDDLEQGKRREISGSNQVGKNEHTAIKGDLMIEGVTPTYSPVKMEEGGDVVVMDSLPQAGHEWMGAGGGKGDLRGGGSMKGRGRILPSQQPGGREFCGNASELAGTVSSPIPYPPSREGDLSRRGLLFPNRSPSLPLDPGNGGVAAPGGSICDHYKNGGLETADLGSSGDPSGSGLDEGGGGGRHRTTLVVPETQLLLGASSPLQGESHRNHAVPRGTPLCLCGGSGSGLLKSEVCSSDVTNLATDYLFDNEEVVGRAGSGGGEGTCKDLPDKITISEAVPNRQGNPVGDIKPKDGEGDKGGGCSTGKGCGDSSGGDEVREGKGSGSEFEYGGSEDTEIRPTIDVDEYNDDGLYPQDEGVVDNEVEVRLHREAWTVCRGPPSSPATALDDRATSCGVSVGSRVSGTGDEREIDVEEVVIAATKNASSSSTTDTLSGDATTSTGCIDLPPTRKVPNPYQTGGSLLRDDLNDSPTPSPPRQLQSQQVQVLAQSPSQCAKREGKGRTNRPVKNPGLFGFHAPSAALACSKALEERLVEKKWAQQNNSILGAGRGGFGGGSGKFGSSGTLLSTGLEDTIAG